jgi:4-carboxymuconolactone decarboxylase
MDADPTPETALDPAGQAVRRRVLGDAHVDRAAAATTPFTAPFQQYVTRAAWGGVWARPGLDLPTRSLLTLAVLTALRCEEELAMHVAAAVRLGVTATQIREALLHATVYAGAPAGNAAFAVAQRVLAELGVSGAQPGSEDPAGAQPGSDPAGAQPGDRSSAAAPSEAGP